MNWRNAKLAGLTVALITLLTLSTGCDDWLREASYVLDDVADVLDDAADHWDDCRHCDDHNDWDDIWDDIEDWFD